MRKQSKDKVDLQRLYEREISGEITGDEEQLLAEYRGLPMPRYEWTKEDYRYYYGLDSKEIFRRKLSESNVERLPAECQGKILILKSVPNQSGGYIHVNAKGGQEWDLYCERKSDFYFINNCPY